MSLSDQEYLRYSRHIMLKAIDESGQEAFKNAHVVIIGMGGLGCPAAQYLAASGVGQLTLIDADRVSESNLQRQILFSHEDVGKSKVQVAEQWVGKQNPFVQVNAIAAEAQHAELESLLDTVDVVLDCTDNPQARFFINRCCVKSQVKLVSTSAIQGQGQLCSFDFSSSVSPCYQCLFPDIQEPQKSCLDSGVFSPLLGVMGSMQAAEALNLLLGKSRHLNKLTMFDGFAMSFKRLGIIRSTKCQCCGDKRG